MYEKTAKFNPPENLKERAYQIAVHSQDCRRLVIYSFFGISSFLLGTSLLRTNTYSFLNFLALTFFALLCMGGYCVYAQFMQPLEKLRLWSFAQLPIFMSIAYFFFIPIGRILASLIYQFAPIYYPFLASFCCIGIITCLGIFALPKVVKHFKVSTILRKIEYFDPFDGVNLIIISEEEYQLRKAQRKLDNSTATALKGKVKSIRLSDPETVTASPIDLTSQFSIDDLDVIDVDYMEKDGE